MKLLKVALAVTSSFVFFSANSFAEEGAVSPPVGTEQPAGRVIAMGESVAGVGTNTQPAPLTNTNQSKQPLATTDGDLPDVIAEIQELKRTSGDTITLKVTIVNNSTKEMSFGYSFGDGSTSDIGTVGGIHLLDATNKKKYFVVRDADGKCICSNGLRDIAPGSRTTVWAKFSAPPPSVTKITVEIPHFIPLDDLPIS